MESDRVRRRYVVEISEKANETARRKYTNTLLIDNA